MYWTKRVLEWEWNLLAELVLPQGEISRSLKRWFAARVIWERHLIQHRQAVGF